MHRDIKWENLLLKYNEEDKVLQIKLIDFSIAKEFKDDKCPLKSFIGTPEYRPPEANDEEYDGRYADIWAAGSCLYSFFFGRLPEKYEETMEIVKKSDISDDLKEFIGELLQPDPKKRLYFEDIFLHIWFL